MFRWLIRTAAGKLRRDERGAVAIEFAFAIPLLIIVVVGTVEVGRVVSQGTILHKSLRAGAAYAAQVPDVNMTTAERATVENLVKYGNPSGSGTPLLPGWGETGASLNIDTSGVYDPSGVNMPIIRLSASVPYSPMLPGLLPLGSMNISLSHEQAHVGD